MEPLKDPNMYESEITQFLKELKKSRPDLEKSQLEGRALLWDKNLDEDLLRDQQQSRIPQSPYVYQTQ
jgi:hypothetical protein